MDSNDDKKNLYLKFLGHPICVEDISVFSLGPKESFSRWWSWKCKSTKKFLINWFLLSFSSSSFLQSIFHVFLHFFYNLTISLTLKINITFFLSSFFIFKGLGFFFNIHFIVLFLLWLGGRKRKRQRQRIF